MARATIVLIKQMPHGRWNDININISYEREEEREDVDADTRGDGVLLFHM